MEQSAFIKTAISLGAALLCLVLADGANAFKVVGPGEVPGAEVVKKAWQVPFQKRVKVLSPSPKKASRDYAKSRGEGCMAWGETIIHPPCEYGKKDSDRTMVLFGDSRAQQYFAPIEKIARERGMRLVVMIRSNCFPAFVFSYERFCDSWRRQSLRRIIRREKPELVVIGSATKELYSLTKDGRKLSRDESQPFLVEGMARTIKLLEKAGSKVVIIRDQTFSPDDVPGCVKDNADDLSPCGFKPTSRLSRAFELEAARQTGARIIDPQSRFCSKSICPPVIGNSLVYLDSYHITSSFALTLTDWFRHRLYDASLFPTYTLFKDQKKYSL